MGIPTSIDTLLSGSVVETARIEFKETWDPEASLKTICAFANDIDNWGGGYLVLGVRDDNGVLDPVGVPTAKVDSYMKDLLNKCKLIQPAYMPITDVADRDGKTFIVVWAPGGSTRPYSSPKSMGKKSQRIRWIRKMSSTVAPSPEEERDLYNLANNVPFDDRVNHAAGLSDLSLPLIMEFLRDVNSDLHDQAATMDFVELCRSMNIVEGPPEYVKPKNVGLMFFNMNPEQFFPYTQIGVVEFPDGEGGDRLFERTFKGPIHQQLRDALQYLRNNVIQERVDKRPDAAEADRVFNYPYAALEEALSNAVYHRGYDSREPVEVRVLPDRIEILSHPGADRSISAEGLREYRAISRRYRNRRVGEFLKELRLTEGRNTGMHKILRALRENGSSDPVFETDEDRLYFLVTIFSAFNEAGGNAAFAPAGRVGRSAARGSGAALRREKLLSLFEKKPKASIAEISEELGVSVATVNRDIRMLKDDELLERVGKSRNGEWKVTRARRR